MGGGGGGGAGSTQFCGRAPAQHTQGQVQSLVEQTIKTPLTQNLTQAFIPKLMPSRKWKTTTQNFELFKIYLI